VLNERAARQAIDCGAQFIVSPHFNPVIIDLCHSAEVDVPVIPGALTPTEIQLAWEAGGDLIKVFPASLGGPRYIREVLAPLPHLRLLPTGGVGMENLGDYLGAGAVAVAVGSSLVSSEIAAAGDWKTLAGRARRFAGLAAAVE
jgi:2-dehydro-3-deoxyphosphogluconate aldolase/(4S)-4-hydroxy-2-oxoglutarate aldolase